MFGVGDFFDRERDRETREVIAHAVSQLPYIWEDGLHDDRPAMEWYRTHSQLLGLSPKGNVVITEAIARMFV